MKCLQMLPVTMLLIFPALTSAELIYSDENIDTPLTVPTGGAASTSLYAPGASGIDNIQGIDGPGDATAYQVGLHSTYTNSHLFYFDGTTNVLVTQNSTLGLTTAKQEGSGAGFTFLSPDGRDPHFDRFTSNMLYIADLANGSSATNGALLKFEIDGLDADLVTVYEHSSLSSPNGVVADSVGNVYAIGSSNDLHKFASDGTHLGIIADSSDGLDEATEDTLPERRCILDAIPDKGVTLVNLSLSNCGSYSEPIAFSPQSAYWSKAGFRRLVIKSCQRMPSVDNLGGRLPI